MLDTNYYIVELDVEGTITDGRLAETAEQAEEFSRSEAEELLVGAIERNFSRTDLDVDVGVEVTDVRESDTEF